MTYNNELPFANSTKIKINFSDYNNINFTINADSYVYVITNVLNLKPNIMYSISFDRTNTITKSCRFYTYVIDNNNYSIVLRKFHEEGHINYTFTTGSSGKVAFAWGGNNTFNGVTMDISNIKLEEGSSATEFEPYQEHVYPISLGSAELNKINNYQDFLYL